MDLARLAHRHRSNTAAEGEPREHKRGHGIHLPSTISNVLQLHLEPHFPSPLLRIHHRGDDSTDCSTARRNTPIPSARKSIGFKWRELHGAHDWDGLLEPLHECLRHELIKYGELTQATYDAFDAEKHSRYRGSCFYGRDRLFPKLGLTRHGYEVTSYLYAMSNIDILDWVVRPEVAGPWSTKSNWMGYVAVSNAEETSRIGRRDIVVAWRGTVRVSEWYKDAQILFKPLRGDAKVEHGFLSLYHDKEQSSRFNEESASEMVMREIRRLVKIYGERDEEVSLTVTGHSLGGALALLSAHEAAAAAIPGLSHVSVISFGAPRVGNREFVKELEDRGVKVLRLVNKQDLVPRMPGAVFNEKVGKFLHMDRLKLWYAHAGVKLKVDASVSPFLKHHPHGPQDLAGFHCLETYLHLVDGLHSLRGGFRKDAKRDIALVNKWGAALRDDLHIPSGWFQASMKEIQTDSRGLLVARRREPEDVPQPPRSPLTAPCN
ncbi:unnamed protein product [Spirodela intermedia]|uniref:Fungal lipase-type domain-containing protein n=1 Tax=Spirodela intermedia TaxID=51605 RepID=A0A811G8V0_SPIIN|nr:unnamed protein product [Spirodela intermedia]